MDLKQEDLMSAAAINLLSEGAERTIPGRLVHNA
jgi:hypothetical protein